MPNSLIHSTLQKLIVKLLKGGLDNYNSTDLTLATDSTDSDSMGERARICINMALHEIYDVIKDSKYLEDYPTTRFTTTAGVDYIELDEEAFLDDIESVVDTLNQFRLVRKSFSWYRKNFPNPATTSNNPTYYMRRGNRLYLAPRPSGAINLTIDFRKYTEDLVLNGDQPLLPSHYDYWIIAEAKVAWFQMEDPSNVPQVILLERESKRQTAYESIFTGYDQILQSESNTEKERLGYLPWQKPSDD